MASMTEPARIGPRSPETARQGCRPQRPGRKASAIGASRIANIMAHMGGCQNYGPFVILGVHIEERTDIDADS